MTRCVQALAYDSDSMEYVHFIHLVSQSMKKVLIWYTFNT